MGIVKLLEIHKKNDANFLDRNTENKVSLEVVKQMLSYFDFTIEDAQKFIKYSKEEELKKVFVRDHKSVFESLTVKERQVFIYVANGKTTAQIATTLFVEPCTISSHRKKIKQKLNLNTTFDWYTYAKAFDLLEF